MNDATFVDYRFLERWNGMACAGLAAYLRAVSESGCRMDGVTRKIARLRVRPGRLIPLARCIASTRDGTAIASEWRS
jgi:hypothetical protein